MVPSEYREIRFRTAEELAEAIKGKDVWETPPGYLDLIGGMRIFKICDIDGNLTDECAVYVKDREVKA